METATIITPAGAEIPQAEPLIETKAKNAFKPDMLDILLAPAVMLLGYLFSCWMLFTERGWGITAFTTAYLTATTAYLMKKGVFTNSRAAWFWMAVTWTAGASYALWENASIAQNRTMFLFCSAVYYVITASGRTLMGKTGNYLVLDGINAVVIIPFMNFANQYVSFAALTRKKGKRGSIWPVIAGVAIALILAAMLIPMLKRADSGGFGIVTKIIADIFTIRRDLIFEILVYTICAIPVSAYIYGLLSGAAHDRNTGSIKPEAAKKTVAALRLLQPSTVFIVLGAVCALYLVFILSQIPYFFSAFTGRRPEGWLIYSEYARHGFFELCRIAAINLAIITAGNVACRKQRTESRMMKTLNIALAIITLVLIVTAFSKMALYIGAYGLTMPRLLPCIFMAFLTAVFVALMALQKWSFSIVRFALVTGSVMLCALFLCNPDALVVRYNTGRYLTGTLQNYDVDILYRSGRAGVLPAIKVYENTSNEQLKAEIGGYLEYYKANLQRRPFILGRGIHENSLETHIAREALK